MNDLIPERTPFVIAAEINTIKYHTEKILLASAIEIGRRLKEAKVQLPYGEWGKWLENSVNYSQKTADRLMRAFDAYGAKADACLDSETQAQAVPNLSYTHAIILLGIPKEEREQFIIDLDVESMSTRELQKAVNERKKTAEERDQAIKERDQALLEKVDLQKTLTEQAGQITQLSTECDTLKLNAEELKNSKLEAEGNSLALKNDLDSLRKITKAESVEKLQKDLKTEQIKSRAGKIVVICEGLDKTFKDLSWELKSLAANDPEVYKVYRKRVKDLLSRYLEQKL